MELQEQLNELNKKLDELIKYQRRQQILGWIKGILWTILFIIFVVLPVIFTYNFVKNPGDYIDLNTTNSYLKLLEQLR